MYSSTEVKIATRNTLKKLFHIKEFFFYFIVSSMNMTLYVYVLVEIK